MQPAGTVFVWSFSGFMLTMKEDFGVCEVTRDGLTLLFDAPKRAASPTWRPIPQLTEKNLAAIFPGGSPTPYLRLALLPTIDENGRPGLQSVWNDDVSLDGLPKDTFVILASGNATDEERQRVAQEALDQVFAWLRILTKQWWIGRPAEALCGNLHFTIPMGAGGKATAPPQPVARTTTPTEGSKRVSAALWKDVMGRVNDGITPDPISLLKADAIYHYFTFDYRTALLLTCSIAELERDRIVETNGIRKNDMKAADTDLLKHVSEGFGRILNRNMELEQPEAFAFLKACWIARGAVAHGKPLVWILDGARVPFADFPTDAFIERLESVSSWLRSIP